MLAFGRWHDRGSRAWKNSRRCIGMSDRGRQKETRVPTTRVGRLLRLGLTAGQLAAGGVADCRVQQRLSAVVVLWADDRYLDRALSDTLRKLDSMTPDQLRDDRYERFRGLGSFLA